MTKKEREALLERLSILSGYYHDLWAIEGDAVRSKYLYGQYEGVRSAIEAVKDEMKHLGKAGK